MPMIVLVIVCHAHDHVSSYFMHSQSGGLVETVERQIENLEPDLVVMGSDLLDAPTALKSITSISSQVTGRAAPASTLVRVLI